MRPSPAPAAAPRAPRIGYVVKVFPRLSETFIVNEIRTLEGWGEQLCVLSLHHGDASITHGIVRELRSPVLFAEDRAVAGDDEVQRTRKRLIRDLAIAPELQALTLPRKYVRLALGLAELIREQKVEHVHAHFASRSGHVAALAAALAGCSFSLTAHAKDIYHQEVDPRLLRWKLSRAAFVVTVTEYNLRYLRELVGPGADAAGKIVRLYNGVDLQRFQQAAPASGTPLLLAIGRLVEKKGFPILIEACRILRERGYDFRCEIIGDGDQATVLAQQVAAAGLEGIVALPGIMSTEAVARRLSDATLMVLPCVVGHDGNVDALPTVLLEAMASGVAVVSTRLSGIPEIVADGETGLLVPPGEAQPLANAMAALLDDPQRTRAMAAAGRRRAAQLFDLQTNVAELRRLLHGGSRNGGGA